MNSNCSQYVYTVYNYTIQLYYKPDYIIFMIAIYIYDFHFLLNDEIVETHQTDEVYFIYNKENLHRKWIYAI